MADAGSELQKAIYAALTAALSCDVHGRTPAAAAYPFVVIGEDTSVDWDTQGATGESLTVTLHGFSTYAGAKEIMELRGQIAAALHEATLALDSLGLVSLRREFATVFTEPDGRVRHLVMRFRALVTTS
jgi:hypothetical protein